MLIPTEKISLLLHIIVKKVPTQWVEAGKMEQENVPATEHAIRGGNPEPQPASLSSSQPNWEKKCKGKCRLCVERHKDCFPMGTYLPSFFYVHFSKTCKLMEWKWGHVRLYMWMELHWDSDSALSTSDTWINSEWTTLWFLYLTSCGKNTL